VDDQGIEEMLSADQIAAKTSGLARGEVPVGCTQLTAFIDVQKELLFYVVVAWRSDFTGYVVDYGAYPDQDRAFFSLRDARNTLSRVSPRADLGGAIRAGLDALADRLMGREWERDDGAVMRIGRCLVDANWGKSTDTVYHFCRESVYAPILVPSHGRGVTASNIPFADYRRKAGDEVGHNWRIPNVRGKKMPRHVMYDTNYWKTFVHERLAVAKGDGGCLSLWGRKADQHRLFAEHLTAEVPIKTRGLARSTTTGSTASWAARLRRRCAAWRCPAWTRRSPGTGGCGRRFASATFRGTGDDREPEHAGCGGPPGAAAPVGPPGPG